MTDDRPTLRHASRRLAGDGAVLVLDINCIGIGASLDEKKYAMSAISDTAIAYAMRGWKVLPVTPREKTPFFPIAKAGYKSATNNPAEVALWFRQEIELNFGIACAPSKLVVFDVDFRNGGDTQGLNLDTFTVRTGDGLHLYYKASGESFAGKLRQGVDIKFNGYVVAPTSIHPNGAMYEVINDCEPAERIFA